MLLQYSNYKLEVGCDEVGRGCLAGPVVAAVVVLPNNFFHKDIDDSKKLTEIKRYSIADYIKKNAICYAIEEVSEIKIDTINILQASILAMHKALEKLNIKPDFIVVDGNQFKKYKEISHQTIVKGDGKYMNIAAASILAKTYRDHLMEKLHTEFPIYNWRKNKGYPTLEHRKMIQEKGITKYHRKSFKLYSTHLETKFRG